MNDVIMQLNLPSWVVFEIFIDLLLNIETLISKLKILINTTACNG